MPSRVIGSRPSRGQTPGHRNGLHKQDAPIHIGVADDPGDFDGYQDFVLVDVHQVERLATSTAPEHTETAKALTLFADWEPGAYDRLN
ncbi:DUF6225 family protein [Streptomyces sp. NPDC097727]|uniref:DUF6225 family protein n=1 Tax=Streptomyces sp. NPDC097727 TaxID=3366092 RepID=UPI0037F6307E